MLRIRIALLLTLCLASFACETSEVTRRGYQKDLLPFLQRPRYPVVIIPGYASTRLFDPVTKKFVWGTARSTVHLEYEDDLDLPVDAKTGETSRDRLVPLGTAGSRGPINIAWRLSHALTTYGDYPPDMIYVLDYDWRLDVTDGARALDALVERIRRERHDPTLRVDLLAHSAGGAIAQCYVSIGTASLEDSSAWEAGAREAATKIRKVVLISTPQRGTAEALRVLVRGERFVRRDLSPVLMATFALLVELLPLDAPLLIRKDGSPVDADLFDVASWRRLGISIFRSDLREQYLRLHSPAELELAEKAFAKNLVRARMFRNALERSKACPSCLRVIAGDCVPTAHRVLMRPDGSFAFYRSELRDDEKKLAAVMFEPGDGSITASSSTAVAANPVLFCDGHQGIASDPQVHRAILRLLLGE